MSTNGLVKLSCFENQHQPKSNIYNLNIEVFVLPSPTSYEPFQNVEPASETTNNALFKLDIDVFVYALDFRVEIMLIARVVVALLFIFSRFRIFWFFAVHQ